MELLLGVLVLLVIVAVVFGVWSAVSPSRRGRATARGTHGGMRTHDGSAGTDRPT